MTTKTEKKCIYGDGTVKVFNCVDDIYEVIPLYLIFQGEENLDQVVQVAHDIIKLLEELADKCSFRADIDNLEQVFFEILHYGELIEMTTKEAKTKNLLAFSLECFDVVEKFPEKYGIGHIPTNGKIASYFRNLLV